MRCAPLLLLEMSWCYHKLWVLWMAHMLEYSVLGQSSIYFTTGTNRLTRWTTKSLWMASGALWVYRLAILAYFMIIVNLDKACCLINWKHLKCCVGLLNCSTISTSHRWDACCVCMLQYYNFVYKLILFVLLTLLYLVTNRSLLLLRPTGNLGWLWVPVHEASGTGIPVLQQRWRNREKSTAAV